MATLKQQIDSGCNCAKPKEINCECSSHDLPPPEKKPKLMSHDDDTSSEEYENRSEDDMAGDGLHHMTKKEYRKYKQQIDESDGFDVDDFADVFMFSRITPINPFSQEYIDSLSDFSKSAVLQYNTKHGTNWKFAKLIKANAQCTCGFRYYLTFEVKLKDASDDDSPAQIFQALVWDGFPDVVVEFCRPKPNQ